MMSLLNKKIEGEQIREKFFAKAVLNWSRPGQKMSSLEEADAIFYLDNFGSCSPKNIKDKDQSPLLPDLFLSRSSL